MNQRQWVVTFAGVIFAAVLSVGEAQTVTGFSGTLHFRDGASVPFEWIGTVAPDLAGRTGPAEARLEGSVNGQEIVLDFGDVAEIVFADSHVNYRYHTRGVVLITNRAGERFTLANAYVPTAGGGDQGMIGYAFISPITRSLDYARARAGEMISSITIGERIGTMKHSPATGQYFPPTFLYDPFTGHLLEWGTP